MTARKPYETRYPFLPLVDRDHLIARIHQALIPGGILLLAEKTRDDDGAFNRLAQEFHHRLKKENGYTEMAVAQKREALEEVLIPEAENAHHRRILAAGFRSFNLWLKWFNFSAWLCRK